VVGEALGAERAVHAGEAVHVALALVRVRVQLALAEEARPQQRLEPRRPPLVLRPVALPSSLPHSIRRGAAAMLAPVQQRAKKQGTEGGEKTKQEESTKEGVLSRLVRLPWRRRLCC
jgi:hypothetical protein